MTTSDNFGDQVCDLLVSLNYTHCFYVAGGNIMHILNSASKRFTCVPVIHEVSAGIAAEYFNEANRDSSARAFALVTAGPGLTNMITAIAGAFLESRELLVIGGQVKSTDLKNVSLRQNGIQEIDGIELVKSITIRRVQIKESLDLNDLQRVIEIQPGLRRGPVFVEFCLDAQAAPKVEQVEFKQRVDEIVLETDFSDFLNEFGRYQRPVLLIGGGVSRKFAKENNTSFASLPFPVMTTWNATDRISSSNLNYLGRPNTWGQRAANIVLQQADLIMVVGSRLGLQQTGFNWQGFGPLADIVHVDIDENELNRSNLDTKFKFKSDADFFLSTFFDSLEAPSTTEWLEFSRSVKEILPLSEKCNGKFEHYWNPYDFLQLLSEQLRDSDSFIPSSSGGAETVSMQALEQVDGNTVITNKGLASMGYGLAGAIGVAFKTGNRVIHLEGDGGFSQNLQELGTVSKNNLPIKTFIFSNAGYASIRMTQKSYFLGNYLGCDEETGLGLPNWDSLFKAYGISSFMLEKATSFGVEFLELLNDSHPRAFIVPIHPEQTYFPKISSRVIEGGRMESNPLHLMTPDLDLEVAAKVFKYLKV